MMPENSDDPFVLETRMIRGAACRTWANGPKTLRDVFEMARDHGAKEFLVEDEIRISFSAFAKAAATLAVAMVDLGVAKGDRVAILMRNRVEWPVAFMAGALAGAVVTPLNAWGSAEELSYVLTQCGASLAIIDGERLQRLSWPPDGFGALRTLVTVDAQTAAPAQAVSLQSLIGHPAAWAMLPSIPPPEIAIDPEDDATILYTSGSTGRPKGALGTHRNITANLYLAAWAGATARREIPPDDAPGCALLAVPFFHVSGCHSNLLPALAWGTKLVLMRRWDPGLALGIIERERVTAVGGVPTIAWQLSEHPDAGRYDLSSLRSVSYGGAPAAPELLDQVLETVPTANLATAWGMTETSSGFLFNIGQDYAERPTSCGRPGPVCEIRIVGPDEEDLGPEEAGELWVRGVTVVRGYFADPEATAAAFQEGWLRTGDIARRDPDGFCYIVGRAKDMLIRGGENIYCVEVEQALERHPAVQEAALVAIPHRTLGEEPGAIVTLRPGMGASEGELRAWVAGRLAAFKTPVRVLLRDQPLPRTPSGKIIKLALQGAFEANPSTSTESR